MISRTIGVVNLLTDYVNLALLQQVHGTFAISLDMSEHAIIHDSLENTFNKTV